MIELCDGRFFSFYFVGIFAQLFFQEKNVFDTFLFYHLSHLLEYWLVLLEQRRLVQSEIVMVQNQALVLLLDFGDHSDAKLLNLLLKIHHLLFRRLVRLALGLGWSLEPRDQVSLSSELVLWVWLNFLVVLLRSLFCLTQALLAVRLALICREQNDRPVVRLALVCERGLGDDLVRHKLGELVRIRLYWLLLLLALVILLVRLLRLL